jgi:hypothetical protein
MKIYYSQSTQFTFSLIDAYKELDYDAASQFFILLMIHAKLKPLRHFSITACDISRISRVDLKLEKS